MSNQLPQANQFTVRTPVGDISGPIEVWLAAILRVMPQEQRAQVFEQVKRFVGETTTILNPNGTKTIVLRADKGQLKLNGGQVG